MGNRTYDCPWCAGRGHAPDVTRNLRVKEGTTLYYCFRCGAKPSETGPLPLEYRNGGEADDGGGLSAQRQEVAAPHQVGGCSRCMHFLSLRGLAAPQIARANPPWLHGGFYAGHRLFFVDPMTGWWQGRTVSPRGCPRYISRSGMTLETAPLLFMRVQEEGGPTPVVVEGPTDGLALWSRGIPAVVLFGKSYSERKAARLQALLWNTPRVVLALDRDDCEPEKMRWTYELSKWMAVVQWWWEAADPGEAGEAELRRLRKFVEREG